MDFRTLVRIVVRRWIVVIPTLLVALLVGRQVLSSVKPQYEAKGSLLVLCKISPATPAPGTGQAAANAGGGCVNPYSDIEATLSKSALVFSTVMNDPGMKKTIAAQGLSKNYTVTVDPNAPILQVDAKDKKQRVAVDTVKAVMAAVPQQILLREARAHVPPDQQLATDVLSTPVNGTALNASKTRALIAFIALSIAAVLSVALLVESWAQSNQNRRDRRRLRVATPTPVPASAVPVAGGAPAMQNAAADESPRERERERERDRPTVRPPFHAPGTTNVGADNGAAAAAAATDRSREAPLPPGSTRPGRARAKPRRRGGALS